MSDLSNSNFNDKVTFLWGVADLIRDTFSRSDYKDVILPFTVLRRLDCVLEARKQGVLDTYKKLEANGIKDDAAYSTLTRVSKHAFYNISPFSFNNLLDDHSQLAANLQSYFNGFSKNIREVLENFKFDATIKTLATAELLYAVVQRFKIVDLHPDKVSNHQMGYIFEDLIRRYNEALNENPGEHFTPREVIRLMVNLVTAYDEQVLKDPAVSRTISDPCCGTGGMLITAKDHIQEINPAADIYLYGQEVNGETYAICKSDLYIKSETGKDAENIRHTNSLTQDKHPEMRFDYQLANPPYGKDWKGFYDLVKAEFDKGEEGRFQAGLPRTSDGQLLFLQHMLKRMKDVQEGGGRVAIVMNGSPLFTGDAESGESEIRRWILENDWLDAIVALPEQIFYNTGITTYVWILTNHKEPQRKGKVQLINAADFWVPAKKSLGSKRRDISDEHIQRIKDLYLAFAEDEHSKIFATTDFGYRKITIERPLRLNFQVSEERIARLYDQKAFRDLANNNTSGKKKKAQSSLFPEIANDNPRDQQAAIIDLLRSLPPTLYTSKATFEQILEAAAASTRPKITLPTPLMKAILTALGERDENAAICYDKDGAPEPDPELRDTENVPLREDIWSYFAREVEPHVPDAWVNKKIRDIQDGEVGKIGYEINFNRYFYKYQPPRPLEEIEADIKLLERDILEMLSEVAG